MDIDQYRASLYHARASARARNSLWFDGVARGLKVAIELLDAHNGIDPQEGRGFRRTLGVDEPVRQVDTDQATP